MNHLPVGTGQWIEARVCIKLKEALKTGQICGQSQRRKENEKSTDSESNEVQHMMLNANGILNLLGQPTPLKFRMDVDDPSILLLAVATS